MALFVFSACSLLSLNGWVCSGQETLIDTIGKKIVIRTVNVIILNTNGPKISVQQGEQRGSDVAHSRKIEFGDYGSQDAKNNCVDTAALRRR